MGLFRRKKNEAKAEEFVPPPHNSKPGWWCPGAPGHPGPCAMWKLPEPYEQHPHCDQRILHAPGECIYCDRYPDWQHMRTLMKINFSGKNEPGKIQCPADAAVANGSRGDYNLWGGNRAHDRGPTIYVE